MFLTALTAWASALISCKAQAAGSADGVAIRYHFAGAADLAGNTNFAETKALLNYPPAKQFRDLVLDRLAGVAWTSLQLDPGGNSSALLRPLLDDLQQAESAGSFGGHDKERMDFVLAARLDAKSAEAWQKNLASALHGQGEALTAESFSGWRWNRPDQHALWILRARDWVVAGRGEDLLAVRDEYLKNIKKDNHPVTVTKDVWLDADVDWPLLANWAPLTNCPLKLGRIKVEVTASWGRLRTIANVSYTDAVPWQSLPWRTPKDLINSPLSSFTASRNLAAYMKPDQTFSRLSGNPLTNQLFSWALREMALQSYAAWPVTDATNSLRKLGSEAPPIFNSFLQARDRTELNWNAPHDQLAWAHLPLTGPSLKPAHDKSGDFILAELFPMEPKHVPAPDQLLSQIEHRDDLVYYDWELTGMRVMQWRLLTELLPVFPPPTAADITRWQKAVQNLKPPVMAEQPRTPLGITEMWLAELSSPALNNTVTEVTRISPTELKIMRNSQLLFTGFELVVLSHWLADAPVGPIDSTLLPKAKMSGPGIPSR